MDRCGRCYFFHKLREESNDGGWVEKFCCTLLPQTEPTGGYDSFALVISEMGLCECFKDRGGSR